MSKKSNTLVFMIVATIVNIVLLGLFFIIGLTILNIIASYFPSSGLIPALMLIVFVLAIALSFIVYSKLVKWAMAKFSLEDKMDPLLSSKRNRSRNRME